MAGRIDRMGIYRNDDITDIERYGSLYCRKQRNNNVNDYGGNVGDIEKLANITKAAWGSTCLFHNGDIYVLGVDGNWSKFGETESTNDVSPSVTPLNVNRSQVEFYPTIEIVEPIEEPEER